MTKTQRDNFLKHIAAVERLPANKFNFEFIIKHGTGCGTVGCFLGWIPATFPDLVIWDVQSTCQGSDGICFIQEDKNPKGMPRWGKIAEELFGVPERIGNILFCPIEEGYGYRGQQSNIHNGLKDLGDDATNEEVCDMLREFVALVEAGEIEGCKLEE